MSTKTCTKCGETKPLENFSRKLNGFQAKCKACCKVEHKAWHAANREKQLLAKKASYQANREQALVNQKAYYQANRDVLLAYQVKWRAENNDKKRDYYQRTAEVQRAASRRWKAENPDRQRSNEAVRRTRMRNSPPWADRCAMAAIYREARELRALGIDCEVDHIIPLRGKHVSGLHVHTNLRVLLTEDNRRKAARFSEADHG